jgi:putative iron-regulated protein
MVAGRSVHDVIAEVDPALATALRAQIEASLAAAEALVPPFDREISPDNPAGNERARALVAALRVQEQTLLDVFAAFRLTAQVPAR